MNSRFSANISIAFFFILVHVFIAAGAQADRRVLKASSARAKIVEGTDETYSWRVNPKVALDVHTLSKSVGAKRVRFITDKDSLDVKLRPGQSVDFVVLLSGHDSCHTRLENPAFRNYANSPIKNDTIPFILTPYSNISFRVVVNKKDTMWMAFDSGSTGLLLTDSVLQELGRNVNTDSPVNSFALGTLTWHGLPVYRVSRTPHGMAGVFGWNFFDGRVVEIDYDKKLFIVHTKFQPPAKGYSSFPIEYNHGLICIHTALTAGKRTHIGRFLYDDGYERTVLLDTAMLAQQGVPANFTILRRTILHNDHNKEIPVLTILLDGLRFNKFGLDSVPAQLLAAGNPARFITHILGAEVLKRFNTILDFQHNKIYLKPDGLHGLPYAESIHNRG